jgi:hypothetical protein
VGAGDEVPDHDDDQLEPDDEGDGEQLLCARRARPLPGGQQAQPTHRLQQAAQPARQLGVLGRCFLEKNIDGAEFAKDAADVLVANSMAASGLINKSHYKSWLIEDGQCKSKQLNKYSLIKN